MICVHGFNTTRHFHPDCHVCVTCAKVIKSGSKYTVEKDGAKCGDCFETWQAQVSKSPRGGGIKAKPSDARGVVWHMCQAIEAANPAPAARGPVKEGKEGVRDGKMGVCVACKEPIFGVLVQVGGQDMHPECHACKRCKRVFADGESFVRDGSKHTICDACVTAEHEKKVAARPPMQQEVQAVGKASLGKCGSCSKESKESKFLPSFFEHTPLQSQTRV